MNSDPAPTAAAPPEAPSLSPFRQRFARVMREPSARTAPLVVQAYGREEPVPVGATAAALRERGWVVPDDVNDEAVVVETPTGAPQNTASVGHRTRYSWSRSARAAFQWLVEHPAVIDALSPESLAQYAEEAASAMRLQPAAVFPDVGAVFYAAQAWTIFYAVAYDREKKLLVLDAEAEARASHAVEPLALTP